MGMGLSKEVEERVREWLEGPYDEETKQEIRALQKSNPKELTDAFYTLLSFGTGGMRGIMGVGTARLNQYTVQWATQGLCNYILKQKGKGAGVFIGYDSRHHSREFAEVVARVCAGNGIRAYLLDELRPTPFVSFAVREKKCIAGVMITASHNPAEYNGYKVFWKDGGQVVPPHDTGIMQGVDAVKMNQVKMAPLDSPLIENVDEKLDQVYLGAIRPLQFFPEQDKKAGSQLKICYTPLHGTGITLAPKALCDWGFSTLFLVEEQAKPDGNFPTVKFPNPEFKEALQRGIDLLQKKEGDILIANDPDADRMGLVVMHGREPVILTGNEIASLAVHFICEKLKKGNKIPKKGAVVTTIVSTEMIKAIATSYGVECVEVLTGFKYIGEKIHEWEEGKDPHQFLFGAEESYGFLLGTVARDKDAIVTSCFLAELALDAKLQGRTLVDHLNALYNQYGIFREKQFSATFPVGKEGLQQIEKLMARLRENPPSSVGGQKIVAIEDYSKGERKECASGKTEKLTLPVSDVLLYRLSDRSKLVIRPSGTEPKIKIYAAVHLKTFPSLEAGFALCDKALDQLISALKNQLKLPG